MIYAFHVRLVQSFHVFSRLADFKPQSIILHIH